MKTDSATRTGDIAFNCHHCGTQLLVDPAAAGLMLGCPGCGTATDIPPPTTREPRTQAYSRQFAKFEANDRSRGQGKVSVLPNRDDWLNDCAFQSRQDPIYRSAAPGILGEKIEKSANTSPSVTPLKDAPILAGRQISPLADVSATAKPAAKVPTVADHVAWELGTFRHLSASVYCPRGRRDSLPENILFCLIALLAGAWPILALFGAMNHR